MQCQCGGSYQPVCDRCEIKGLLFLFALEMCNSGKFPEDLTFENVHKYIDEFLDERFISNQTDGDEN